MSKYRDRLQIIADILSIVGKGVRKRAVSEALPIDIWIKSYVYIVSCRFFCIGG